MNQTHSRHEISHTDLASSSVNPRDLSAYGFVFWCTFVANVTLMFAISILFRYADFVTYLGGTESRLGLIVGIGMIGSLLARCVQGVAIDRHGPRRVWLISLMLMVTSLLSHLAINQIDGLAIYAARILFATSVAGAFGASITYISLQAPPHKMAEIIGMLGTSGFVGMAVGPGIGDWLLGVDQISRSKINMMFVSSALLVSLSLLFAHLATRQRVSVPHRRRVPVWRVLRRYHPGALMLVGVAMGFGIGLPHTFLRTYVAELGFGTIRTFFLVYACVAISIRVLTRRRSDFWGTRPAIQLGLLCMGAAMLSFMLVINEWTLIIPAVFGGTSHAFLFPSVVSRANHAFPIRYRGLATTAILAMFDIGNMFGQPFAGGVVDSCKHIGIPPYHTMFTLVALGMGTVSLIYCLDGHRRNRRRDENEQPRAELAGVDDESKGHELASCR